VRQSEQVYEQIRAGGREWLDELLGEDRDAPVRAG
jgi:hypothetical protein